MSDRVRSWLRTTVPGAWAALVTYLASLGAPQWATELLGEADAVVVVIVLSVVYALLRWAEPHLPPLATRILLGSNTPPTYQ